MQKSIYFHSTNKQERPSIVSCLQMTHVRCDGGRRRSPTGDRAGWAGHFFPTVMQNAEKQHGKATVNRGDF